MRSVKVIAGVAVALVLLVVGGTWVYLNVLRDDAPERLALSPETSDGTETTEAPETDGAAGLEGTWTAAPGSTAGYRVPELLFGQEAEAVGRTEDVTGTVTVEGSTVTDATFEVDMTTIRSDQDRRDGQFHGRIMDTARFPTATFRLTEPIDLGPEALEGELVTAAATGELTLRGTTRPVELDLDARQTGDTFEVVGSLTIVFSEWGIPDPSNVAASVGDEGLLELLLVLERS